jgi:hypothetical protein
LRPISADFSIGCILLKLDALQLRYQNFFLKVILTPENLQGKLVVHRVTTHSCGLAERTHGMIGYPDVAEIGTTPAKPASFASVWFGADFQAFRQAHFDGNIPAYCRRHLFRVTT